MKRRITQRSSFGPSLLWEGQPIVGAQDRGRRDYRARVWRFVAFGLSLFWIGVGAVIVRIAGG